MKHLFYIISLFVSIAFASCELESSSNGKLDGYWHLERIDSVEGSTQVDMKGQRLFWSFQHHLLELDDRNGKMPSILLRFEKNGNMLHLYSPYLYNREQGDEPLTDIAPLLPYGVNGLEDLFTIERMKSEELQLLSSKVRLHFKRF